MNAKIIVAMHKPSEVPEGGIYMPLHVGKNGAAGFGVQGDDTGDNISGKNPYFCELTGIYWAWKNLDCDYIGLVHYRRYFSIKKGRDPLSSVLNGDQLDVLLKKSEVLLPRRRKYYIESIYSHYCHTHSEQHLIALREVIARRCPEYLNEFERLKSRTSAHMFNMLIMKREMLNEYCEWLFGILFELEGSLDLSQCSAFEARVFGRLSELMLDMWIEKNGIKYLEIPFVYMGKVNYFKKVTAFLSARFLKKGYKKSF